MTTGEPQPDPAAVGEAGALVAGGSLRRIQTSGSWPSSLAMIRALIGSGQLGSSSLTLATAPLLSLTRQATPQSTSPAMTRKSGDLAETLVAATRLKGLSRVRVSKLPVKPSPSRRKRQGGPRVGRSPC